MSNPVGACQAKNKKEAEKTVLFATISVYLHEMCMVSFLPELLVGFLVVGWVMIDMK